MSGTRIPEIITEFDAYINNTDTSLQAISSGVIHNWERLGLDAADATEWHDRRVFWRDDLHVKYIDPAQSTSIIKANVRSFINDFRTFGNPQLNIMAASLSATEADEAIFNFKRGHADPTHSTTALTDVVLFEAKRLGGGDVQFICTVSTDDTRGSKPEGADCLQVSYLIQGNDTTGSPGPTPTPNPGDSGGSLPNADDPKMIKEIFTKTHFTKHFGTNNIGKMVVIFMRWYNTKHPELAGPWSDVKVIVIA